MKFATQFPQMNNYIHFPKEIWLIILGNLDVRSLCTVGTVCKMFRELSVLDTLWKSLQVRNGIKFEECLNSYLQDTLLTEKDMFIYNFKSKLLKQLQSEFRLIDNRTNVYVYCCPPQRQSTLVLPNHGKQLEVFWHNRIR